MNKYFVMTFVFVLVLFSGCDLLLYSPVTITGYSPAAQTYPAGAPVPVWVEFSREVDHTKAEASFTLSNDGTVMDGRYEWSGNRVNFVPAAPFSTGTDYILNVTTDVEDKNGNSLDHSLVFRFRFGTDSVRPEILSVTPVDNTEIAMGEFTTPVTMTFSEPIDRASLYEAFGISPSKDGNFTWHSGDTVVVFTPGSPYALQKEYVITVNTALSDLEGNKLGKSFTTHFVAGNDHLPPEIVSVACVPVRTAVETAIALDEYPAANPGWETDWGFTLTFADEGTGGVTKESLANCISFTPGWDFTLVYDPVSPLAATLVPKNISARFEYGKTYTMLLKSGISDLQGNKINTDHSYVFTVNGPRTRPIRVVQVDFFDSTTLHTNLQPLEEIPITPNAAPAPQPRSYFEIHLDTADDVTISPASCAPFISLSITNGCLEYTAISIVTDSSSVSGADYCVRITYELADTSNLGLITLLVDKDLCDTSIYKANLHNTLEADWSLTLRDEPL